MIASITEGFADALRDLVAFDADSWHPIVLSLWTSVAAVAIGAALGIPLGTWLGVAKPRGRGVAVLLLRAGMGFPTVVVGLFLVALLTTRDGPLGSLGWLYHPQAIVLGQAILAFPILATLAHGAAEGLDPRVVETVRTHGGGTGLAVRLSISEARPALVAALLVAFGRVLTELGVVLVAGGGIRGVTRTMPALIALEVGKGQDGRAFAYGILLVLLACGAAIVASRARPGAAS